MATSGQYPNMTLGWLKMRAGWKEEKVVDLKSSDGSMSPNDFLTEEQKLKMAKAYLES